MLSSHATTRVLAHADIIVAIDNHRYAQSDITHNLFNNLHIYTTICAYTYIYIYNIHMYICKCSQDVQNIT